MNIILSKKDASVQTEPKKHYNLKVSFKRIKRFYTHNEFINIRRNAVKGFTLEDYLIDRILLQKTKIVREIALSQVVKNPFQSTSYLSMKYEGIQLNIPTNLHEIKQVLKKLRMLDLVSVFEETLAKVYKDKYSYFDHFKRFNQEKQVSLCELFCVFLIWTEDLVNPSFFAKLTEFFLIFFVFLVFNAKLKDYDEHFFFSYIKGSCHEEMDFYQELMKSLGLESLFTTFPRTEIIECLKMLVQGVNMKTKNQ